MMRLGRLFGLLRLRELALGLDRCPFCGPSVFVRLRADELGVRCMRCAGSAVHLSLGRVLRRRLQNVRSLDACELSARGPVARYLRRNARNAALSEYVPGSAPGEVRAGVRCEDVQNLTYADASFDLITHTEVLEHVPDDAAALAELHRVLRPGGLMLFTVPLHGGETTVERARLRGNAIEHLQAPIYHGDPLRGGEPILAFRDYGEDIVRRLRAAGFTDAWIERPESGAAGWGYARPVACARR